MKKLSLSALILLAMASLSCGQTAKKKEDAGLLARAPQQLWKYDTGG
ncbi:MAG: hypothetical protein M3R52_02305 [Acidobacteriota bacterium]|nr:hypothetical protein [Acidobacteriota bacterium]